MITISYCVISVGFFDYLVTLRYCSYCSYSG